MIETEESAVRWAVGEFKYFANNESFPSLILSASLSVDRSNETRTK